mgnify:CR=1 FL=1
MVSLSEMFHVGIVVPDLDVARARFTQLLGVDWGPVMETELPVRAGDGRERVVPNRMCYSTRAPYLELIQEVFYKPDPAARDAARLQAAVDRIGAVYARYEGEFAGPEYLCGDFSVADVAWFLTIGFASSLGAPPPASATIGAWLGRVGARPSVQREQAGMRAAVLALSEPSRAA